jgi:hypothetical protein
MFLTTAKLDEKIRINRQKLGHISGFCARKMPPAGQQGQPTIRVSQLRGNSASRRFAIM